VSKTTGKTSRRPHCVFIAGLKVSITWTDEIEDTSGSNRYLFGQFREVPQAQILISQQSALDVQRSTLLHEVIHAIVSLLNLPGGRKDADPITEEDLVRFFESNLFATFSDPRNRTVKDFIFQ